MRGVEKRLRGFGASTLRRFDASTLRRFDASTLRRFDASTLRRFDASTLRRFDASTLRRFDASTLRPPSSGSPAAARGLSPVLRAAARAPSASGQSGCGTRPRPSTTPARCN
ncbi:hypothetical protein GA845_25880 [Burkholderia pseudomallei]|nr:hypothetical protein [Burkholderia pseudomallei]